MAIEITADGECDAPLDKVFAYVADYTNTPKWFFGMKSFEPLTEVTYGLGSTFEAKVVIGVPLKSTIKCTDFVENEVFEMDTIKGFKNTSRWSFSEHDGHTHIHCDFSYELPFGPAGKVIGKAMEPVIGVAVNHITGKLSELAGR